MNHKKLYRIYLEEGLAVRRLRGRKRARGSRTPMHAPLILGAGWSMDFMSDTFGASGKFRILAVNDDCGRENPCLVGDTGISGARVARELDTLVRLYGKPACIVSDNGTEFTSRAILGWAGKNNVEWHYIDPGMEIAPDCRNRREAFGQHPPRVIGSAKVEQGVARLLSSPRSKGDQEGEGATAYLGPRPVRAIAAWLEAAGIEKEAVFRRVNVWRYKEQAAVRGWPIDGISGR